MGRLTGMAENDMLNKTITSIITALIAIVMVASVLIPTVVPMINNLLEKTVPEGGGEAVYIYGSNIVPITSLIWTVLTFVVIGILIGVIKTYASDKSDSDSGERAHTFSLPSRGDEDQFE